MEKCIYCDECHEEDEEVFINTETGEVCCSNLDSAVVEYDYKEFYDNYSAEIWDDLD